MLEIDSQNGQILVSKLGRLKNDFTLHKVNFNTETQKNWDLFFKKDTSIRDVEVFIQKSHSLMLYSHK